LTVKREFIMDIWTIFKRIEEFEDRLALCYDHFQKVFYYNPSVASFFFSMGMDEKSHGDIVRYQIRILQKNKPAFKKIDIDMSKIDEALAKIDNIIAVEPSIKDALQFTFEIESSAAEFYLISAGRESNSELSVLLDNFSLSCKEHFINTMKFMEEQNLAL
jgi:rubrerythrin